MKYKENYKAAPRLRYRFLFIFCKIILPFQKLSFTLSFTLQGGIGYDAFKKLLVYATGSNPYIALYDCNPEIPTLVSESQIGEPHYTIQNGELIWDFNQMKGFMSVAFTKDYIACLSNEKTLQESRGRDEKNLPHSIYLFDYNGKLIKIVDVDYPLLRMACNTSNNTLYFIGLIEEYSLFRLNLDNCFQ